MEEWCRHARQRNQPDDDRRWNCDFPEEKSADCREPPRKLSSPECPETVIEAEAAESEVEKQNQDETATIAPQKRIVAAVSSLSHVSIQQ